ncbi:MAG: hypothetical protein HGA24_08450, partial [Candidatus Aminicenantes bacterium]|nr:hypothetical protein [Candidatus Aminicenantes bacterium]
MTMIRKPIAIAALLGVIALAALGPATVAAQAAGEQEFELIYRPLEDVLKELA